MCRFPWLVGLAVLTGPAFLFAQADALPKDKVDQHEQVSGIVSGLAFSAKGRYLAVAATNGGNWVYEVESKKLLHKYRKFNYAGPVAFAPDGKLWLAGFQRRKDPDRNTEENWTSYQAIDLEREGGTLEIKTTVPCTPWRSRPRASSSPTCRSRASSASGALPDADLPRRPLAVRRGQALGLRDGQGAPRFSPRFRLGALRPREPASRDGGAV